MRGIVALCALAFVQTLCAAPADDIQALLEKGDAKGAYELGRQHRGEFGNPAFDFYFGIAAIETGHAGEGVLALERYVLTFPDNVSARLQLARGYFALGEDARAREEFESLRAINPPPDVAAAVDRFLDAIRLRESRYTFTGGAYVELGIGYDSNVSGGIRSNFVDPFFGPVDIALVGLQRRHDGFTNVAAGGYLSYPVAPGVALFANAQGDARFNWDGENSRFDVGNYNLSGGVTWLREKNLFRLGLNYNELTLDGRHLRGAPGASLEWHYQIDERQAFSLGGQYASFRYNDANQPRDADFFGLVAAYRRQFSHAWAPVLYLTANAGTENSKEDRDDFVRDLWGGRIGVSFTPAAKWGVAAGYSYTRSDYKGPVPPFGGFLAGVTRNDDYHAVDAAVTYLYSRTLSFRGEFLASRNDSNIPAFTFPREIYLLKARYEFK
jgi:hypothetical protein